jgi:hypothetical protein
MTLFICQFIFLVLLFYISNLVLKVLGIIYTHLMKTLKYTQRDKNDKSNMDSITRRQKQK